MKKLLLLLTCLSAISWTQTPSYAVRTEVYLADRGWNVTNPAWDGLSQATAYNVNGWGQNKYWFDEHMSSFADTNYYAATLAIHLFGRINDSGVETAQGTLPTYGNLGAWSVKPNWTISGTGANSQVFLKDVNQSEAVVFYGTGLTNVTIRDFVINCNGSQLMSQHPTFTNWMIRAIVLDGGDNLKVSNVTAFYGVGRSSTESFFIMLGSSTATSSLVSVPNRVSGWEISNCTVDDYLGGYCSAITMNGSSSYKVKDGWVSGCHVTFPPPASHTEMYTGTGDAKGSMFAYNSCLVDGITFTNNVSQYGHRGHNNDCGSTSGDSTGMKLIANTYNGPYAWGLLLGSSATNCVMDGNTIVLQDGHVAGATALVIGAENLPGGAGAHHWTIKNNVFRDDSTTVDTNNRNRAIGYYEYFSASTTPYVGMVFQNNKFETPKMAFQYITGAESGWSGNTDLSLNALSYPGCDSSNPPAGVTRYCP